MQQPAFTQKDLQGWKVIADFKGRLAQAFKAHAPSSQSWKDPKRLLSYEDYLSLFLFGLLNPVVRTMRGLCQASGLDRLQREVCSRPVSLGSFSESQHLLDTELLSKVFGDLATEVKQRNSHPLPQAGGRSWLIQDSSLFEALPRMYWTFWRRQKTPQFQVRLHLSLDAQSQSPQQVVITPGKGCERAAWRKVLKAGQAYLGDCYFGEDYKMFGQLEEKGVAFVVRLRDEAVINQEEDLPLSQADKNNGVIRSRRARLGRRPSQQSIAVRVIEVQTPERVLRLATNLTAQELSAADVALLYKERWRVELFFRWVKCILGCRHWLAHSEQGAATQVYLALIAALLLQLYTGERPGRRLMEAIQFYLLGIAKWEELWRVVEQAQQRRTKNKKN